MYRVTLRRVFDGETKTIEFVGKFNYFMWTDGGDYGCDCNRSIFFGDATLETSECMPEGRYELVGWEGEEEDID